MSPALKVSSKVHLKSEIRRSELNTAVENNRVQFAEANSTQRLTMCVHAILTDTRVVYAYRISWDIRMAADSTMLRMVNLLIALSLGVHREQLEQRTGLTWPRPFLLRPLESC